MNKLSFDLGVEDDTTERSPIGLIFTTEQVPTCWS
jgi:hypothetical protein